MASFRVAATVAHEATKRGVPSPQTILVDVLRSRACEAASSRSQRYSSQERNSARIRRLLVSELVRASRRPLQTRLQIDRLARVTHTHCAPESVLPDSAG